MTFQNAIFDLHHSTSPMFAVLDGAQFEDLPQHLLLGGFIHKPLYLDRGDNDPQQVVTAPHLVWLDGRSVDPQAAGPEKTLPALLDLIGGRPRAVFWQCPDGGEALYKHLRGINMVMYPRAHLPEEDMPESPDEEITSDAEPEAANPFTAEINTPVEAETDTESEQASHELVLFRHADANVMAQVVPAMTPEEQVRLMGPATTLLFAPDPEWAGGQDWLMIKQTDGMPPAPPGPLTISEATLDGIEARQIAVSQGRIADYLHEAAPDYTAQLSETELQSLILEAQNTGEAIGVETEYGHGLWALMALMTGGETLHNPDVLNHVKSAENPDDAIDAIMVELAEASDEEWEALL